MRSVVFLFVSLQQTKTTKQMDSKKNISRETWSKIIQVAISILTIISGMFLESCTNGMENLRAMLM